MPYNEVIDTLNGHFALGHERVPRAAHRMPAAKRLRFTTTMNEWKNGWYIVPIEVTFRDLDFFGHVNNAVYFSYFEWARTQLWFELTGSRDPAAINFIVARAECDFRLQIELEPIEVRVRIGEMRTTSLDFVYEIWKTNGQQLASTGRVVVVVFDWKTNAKAPISDELRRKVERLQT